MIDYYDHSEVNQAHSLLPLVNAVITAAKGKLLAR
jgi:hypothetical protein